MALIKVLILCDFSLGKLNILNTDEHGYPDAEAQITMK